MLFAAVAVTAVATAAASLWVSLAAIERDPNLLPPGDQSIASADTSINVLLISADAAKGAGLSATVTAFPGQLVTVSGGETGKGAFVVQCITVDDKTVSVVQGIDYRQEKGPLGAFADQLAQDLAAAAN